MENLEPRTDAIFLAMTSLHELLPCQTWLCGPVLRACGASDGCDRTEAMAGVGGAADAGPEGRFAQGAERQGRRGRGRASSELNRRPTLTAGCTNF